MNQLPRSPERQMIAIRMENRRQPVVYERKKQAVQKEEDVEREKKSQDFSDSRNDLSIRALSATGRWAPARIGADMSGRHQRRGLDTPQVIPYRAGLSNPIQGRHIGVGTGQDARGRSMTGGGRSHIWRASPAPSGSAKRAPSTQIHHPGTSQDRGCGKIVGRVVEPGIRLGASSSRGRGRRDGSMGGWRLLH